MKSFATFFVAAFVCFTTASFAQDSKPVFENASLTKIADGAPFVQLSWKKGSENTAYYLVERSIDGKIFKHVAVVFTSEDANWTAYKYNDKSIGTSGNAVYYRIAMVSGMKEVTYLPVKKVALTATETTIIAPVEGSVVTGK